VKIMILRRKLLGSLAPAVLAPAMLAPAILTVTMLPLALAACNSATVQQAAADAGTARTFNAPYEQVKQAALDGLTALKVPPSETHDQADAFMILVSRAPHGMSWGEVGRVLVEKSSARTTTVRVVYEKRMPLQFGGSESRFARNLFAKMDTTLGTKPAE
jgi:hypothetical protein